ncbi:MAG: hypothetical protein AAFO29_26165, partial [Actinomycetota bacterium]
MEPSETAGDDTTAGAGEPSADRDAAVSLDDPGDGLSVDEWLSDGDADSAPSTTSSSADEASSDITIDLDADEGAGGDTATDGDDTAGEAADGAGDDATVVVTAIPAPPQLPTNHTDGSGDADTGTTEDNDEDGDESADP